MTRPEDWSNDHKYVLVEGWPSSESFRSTKGMLCGVGCHRLSSQSQTAAPSARNRDERRAEVQLLPAAAMPDRHPDYLNLDHFTCQFLPSYD